MRTTSRMNDDSANKLRSDHVQWTTTTRARAVTGPCSLQYIYDTLSILSLFLSLSLSLSISTHIHYHIPQINQS